MKKFIFFLLMILSFSFIGSCGSSNVMKKENLNNIQQKADQDVDKNTNSMMKE